MDRADALAQDLMSHGVRTGERVLLWGPNSAQWVAAFFGCLLRGVIVVPIDHASTAEFAWRVHRQVGAGLIVCSREHWQASIPAMVL